MIIDGHAHACGTYLNGEDIIKTLDKNNAAKVVLVPGELGSDKTYSMPNLAAKFPNTDVIFYTNLLTKVVISISGAAKKIPEGNKYVYSMVQAYPDRIIQFYWVMLSHANALESLEHDYNKYGFKGIKLHQCWESFKISDDNFNQVAEWASSKNLPIFVHLFSKNQAAQLANYIKEHPKTVFIIAHLFGLERYIKANIRSDNIFFEISAPQLISITRLKKAIQYFGPHRIVLGSDIPYGENNLSLNIQRINDLDISAADKELILGNNMKTLLKL